MKSKSSHAENVLKSNVKNCFKFKMSPLALTQVKEGQNELKGVLFYQRNQKMVYTNAIL